MEIEPVYYAYDACHILDGNKVVAIIQYIKKIESFRDVSDIEVHPRKSKILVQNISKIKKNNGFNNTPKYSNFSFCF